MSRKFEFSLPSTSYQNGVKNKKNFENEYGVWTIVVTFQSRFNGTIVFEPIFDAHLINPKQMKINVQISTSNGGNFTSIFAEHRGGTMFWFDTNLNNFYSHTIYQIIVKVELSEITYKPINYDGAKAHLKRLFETGDYSDITIKSSGKELKVHKLILMRSEVFEKMFSGPMKEAQSGVIVIKDFKFEVVAEMCRFLYYDEIPKIETLALLLLIAADKYMIEDLAVKCENFLLKNVNSGNFHDILVIADQLNKNDLREAAIDYIIANRKTIFPSESWKKLKINNVQLALLVTEKFMISNA